VTGCAALGGKLSAAVSDAVGVASEVLGTGNTSAAPGSSFSLERAGMRLGWSSQPVWQDTQV